LNDALQEWSCAGQRWGDAGLLVLPSGELPPNPAELLSSDGMAELLGELEKRVDLVLIDAPPLLPVTDAAVVSALAGATILVVRQGGTKHEQVVRAIEALRRVDVRLSGTVLNMVPAKGHDADGYRYRYQSRPGDDAVAKCQ
jgi:Mrp family chromosome partitioning ATPase